MNGVKIPSSIMTQVENTDINGIKNGEANYKDLPYWLENITLNDSIREISEDFTKISNVHIEKYSKTIQNNSVLMVKISVDYEVKAGTIKTTTFILKTQNDTSEAISNVLKMLKLFQKEERMYQKILPKFEKLYQDVGKCVKFAPKSFCFDRDMGIDYVLLEDLRAKDYKNANRYAGLDMEHMKCVLTKLAEFHAASACYVEHFGVFGEEFTVGIYSDKNRELLKKFNDSTVFLMHLKKWKNGEQYYEKLVNADKHLVDRLLTLQKYCPSEFNVFNHGDCWLNNIMFQYDAFGKIKSTLFVDFQVGKYGTPANDLYYLILSSAAMDIKLNQFDYMVRYYYDSLIENLKILQYHRPLPKLRNLHISLLKNGLTAYLVVSKVLPLIMLDSNDIDNWDDESQISAAMYTNHKYVKCMAEILPWMDNRGLLDWL